MEQKNVVFDDIRVGDKSSYERTITAEDIRDFARVTGDDNPLHLSDEFASQSQFGGIIAHGMLTASYISKILGTQYPGAGTVFLGLEDLSFKGPVRPGDVITTTVTVSEKHPTKPIVKFDCSCVNQDGDTVLTAGAVVKAPTEPVGKPGARP